MLNRIALTTAAAGLVLAFTGTAGADAALAVTARCEGKWVTVAVDVPDTAVVIAQYGGKTVAVGNRFVPDTGGGNPSGDYDITIVLEQWDTTAAGHTIIASGTVRTPNCVPVAPTTTAPPTTTLEAAQASVVRVESVITDIHHGHDVWRHIVEAVRTYV